MSETIDALLSALQIHPVLFDIGTRDGPPNLWERIARHSIYVGVGDESKLFAPKYRDNFYRAVLLEEVATTADDGGEAVLYLTTDRLYSSILAPDPRLLSELVNLGIETEREERVRSTTLNALVDRLDLSTVDWLHTNINGVDLRTYKSVKDSLRTRILAVDTVFYFLNISVGQDTYAGAYEEFTRDGLWLSNLYAWGPVRMRKASLSRVTKLDNRVNEQLLADYHKKAPGWMFARFLRTIDSLAAGDFTRREYVLLWCFAVLDRQFGFAADVAFEYDRVFGADKIYQAMIDETLSGLTKLKPRKSIASLARKVIPAPARRIVRRLLLGY